MSAAAPRSKSARRRSRELALQGLYQWLIARTPPAQIEAHLREHHGSGDDDEATATADDFAKCDRAHFDALLHGGIDQFESLQAAFGRHVDRPLAQLSPIERAALLIGTYELKHCVDVPYRVVINEAVELAKAFGGTDGHKFVNGVLDRTAADLRADEKARRG